VTSAVLAGSALAVSAAALLHTGHESKTPADTLVVRVLDVGQGAATLLDPPGADPVLVDTGPPGAGVADRLRELGVHSLAGLVVSHDASDHTGGLTEVTDSVRVARAATGPDGPRRVATADGTAPVRLAEGGELRSGELRLTALWPPPELGPVPGEDSNRISLVLLAQWRHFSMLLPADAEAELAPIQPGPLDVLEVAHHGSADPGLDSFLDRVAPKLAVISVGENSYGHPTPETLADLREHRISTMRTDEAGEVTIEADASGWRVRG
jgi:competence protein ComEC